MDPEKRSEEDVRQLINSNLAMVFTIAVKAHRKNKSFANHTPVNFTELFSAGIIGLNKAIRKYDSFRQTKFSTYAYFWIDELIRKEIRSIRFPLKTSWYKKVYVNSLDDERTEQVENSGDSVYDNICYRDLLDVVKQLLTPYEHKLFTEYFLNSRSMRKIALKIGSPQSTIQYHIKKIKQKLLVIKD